MSVRPLRRALVSAFGAVTALSLLAGCGGTAESGADDQTPQAGGTLRFALANDPVCIDPQQAGINDSLHVGRQIVDSLTDQDVRTGEIKPWLATSWTVADDARSFSFTLRDDVTFSDGTPLTAEVVKNNFDSIVALGAKARGATYFIGYQGTTVDSPTTFTVRFEQPSVQFLQATATIWLGLLSPATLAASPEDRCQGTVVGTGPFTLESYAAARSATLVRRTGYGWAKSTAEHQGDAYLDRIEFTLVPESSVRAGALLSGQVDAVSTVQPQDEPTFDGNGFQLVYRANPGNVFGLQPNARRPLLQDTAVRQAVNHAIDRRQIVDTVLTDKTAVATGNLADVTPHWTDHTAELGFAPDQAKALLDAAGWVPGPDGIRVKDGTRLTLQAYSYWQKDALELIQQQLRAVGVDLTLNLVTSAQTTAIRDSGDYDYGFFNLTRADPDILRTQFSTTAGPQNFADPELERLFTAQAAEVDPAKRTELVSQIETRLIDQAYVIPVYQLTSIFAVSDKVRGLDFEASSRLDFHDTWVATDDA